MEKVIQQSGFRPKSRLKNFKIILRIIYTYIGIILYKELFLLRILLIQFKIEENTKIFFSFKRIISEFPEIRNILTNITIMTLKLYIN